MNLDPCLGGGARRVDKLRTLFHSFPSIHLYRHGLAGSTASIGMAVILIQDPGHLPVAFSFLQLWRL